MKKRHSALLMAIMVGITACFVVLSGNGIRSAASGEAHLTGAADRIRPANLVNTAGRMSSENLVNTADRIGAADRVSAADQQLESLIELGSANTDGSFISVVKWQGEWETSLSMKQAAAELAKQLGIGVPQPQMVQDHTVYAAEGSVAGAAAKLSVMEIDSGLYVVLLLNGNEGDTRELLAAQEQAGSALLKAGVDADWNGAVQGLSKEVPDGSIPAGEGEAREGEAREGEGNAAVAETLKQLEASVQSMGLKPEGLDAFADGTTASRTYGIPSFSITTVIPGKGLSGLQIGVHTDTESGRQQISFGSPLLTIEY